MNNTAWCEAYGITKPYYADDAVCIIHADCRELNLLGISAIVTDSPYELGFMGESWDSKGVSFQKETWEKIRSYCLSGAPLLSFGGTRTQHRIACAIEDAGWEIRDTLIWVYGSGFPKSLNIGKAVDKKLGNKRTITGYKKHTYPDSDNWGEPKNISSDGFFQSENKNTKLNHIPVEKGNSEWEGYGTGLKPAYEPIVLAMKPLDGTFAENCLKWGVGGLNINGCRIPIAEGDRQQYEFNSAGSKRGNQDRITMFAKPSGADVQSAANGRFPANLILGYPEDEYELKDGITTTEKENVVKWLYENT